MPLRATVPCLLLVACAGVQTDDTDGDVWRGTDTGDSGEPALPLADLTFEAEALGADELNPHGDGSGRVRLTASADDAVRYVFLVEGSAPVEREDGVLEVTLTEEGLLDHTFAVLAFAADGASAREERTMKVQVGSDGRRLIFADEFDRDGAVDPSKWLAQHRPPLDGGWFNGELQHYTERLDNAWVSDGTLKIRARRERYTVEGSARDFTSARLNARFAFAYGRVEVRAKLPSAAGAWPAIWTLGANVNELGNPFGTTYGNVGWPACGEVDILEQVGWDKQHTIAHFHWADTRTGEYAHEGGELRVPTSTTAFHVYALEWDAERLEVFVDDDLVWSMPNAAGRPYDNPHYLLLNVAVGGNLGGDVPASFDEAVMEVDWVRIYE